MLHTAKIERIQGAPALTVDGRPIPMMAYQWRLGIAIDSDPGHDSRWQIENMARAGVELFFTEIQLDDPARFEELYSVFMSEMELLTEIVPDALVIPWIRVNPYADFARKYPGDVIRFDNGSTGEWTELFNTGLPSLDTPRFTYASEAWKREVGGLLLTFIRRLYAGPYAETIIGYFFFLLDQECSYFFEYDVRKRCIDFSPAMCSAFRDHLIEKYQGDEQLLRSAWDDESVTFSSVQIPDLAERTTGDFGYFRDPGKSQKCLDYAECHNETASDKLEYFGKICKEESDDRAVVGAFWGYLQNQDIQMGGHARFKKLLDSPYVDIWSSPFTYENRFCGNFASMRMAIQTLNCHNKLFFAEVDTFLSDTRVSDLKVHNYPDQSKSDDEAVLKRDFVYPFCEGANGWWIDWCSGVSQYRKDGLRPLMRKLREIGEEGFKRPRGNVSDVAAAIDQESLLIPACNSYNHFDGSDTIHSVRLMRHNLDRFRVHELCRLGTPVDFYETDDILEGREYRLYIFMNQYAASSRERRLIDEKLKKNGHVLVWMYGCGIIGPNREISLENAEALTDIRFGCEMRETESRMRLAPAASELGLEPGLEIGCFDRPIGGRRQGRGKVCEPSLINPVLYADDPGAETVAEYLDGGKPGFAIKKFEGWTSVYIGSPGVSASVLRALAKLAGVHRYVDGEDIVFANQSYLGIHTNTDGMRSIHLKANAAVTEAFQERSIGGNIREFSEYIQKNTTRLYRIEEQV